jgi:hypothetical protein
MHPAIESILTYFEYGHLPPPLREVSKPFGDLAHHLANNGDLQHGAELTVCLRKLLEAKDCAVRAALPPGQPRI